MVISTQNSRPVRGRPFPNGTSGNPGGRKKGAGGAGERAPIDRGAVPDGTGQSLTPRQQRFVQEYLVDCNGTQAAIRSGYSPRTARFIAAENLTKPNIQQAVAKAQQALAQRTGVDQEYVVRHLVANVERAMQERPVLDREGNPTGEYVYAGSVANKALELLGQHLGMFKHDDKAPVQGDTHNTLVLQGFSIEELRSMLTTMKGEASLDAPARRMEALPRALPAGDEPKIVPGREVSTRQAVPSAAKLRRWGDPP